MSYCSELNKREKNLLNYLVNFNTTGRRECELGYDYFIELCDNYKVKPTKKFVDILCDYGIGVETRLEQEG